MYKLKKHLYCFGNKAVNNSLSNIKTILITGANKGLGFGVAKELLEKELFQSSLSNKDKNANITDNKIQYNVILTARSQERGLASMKNLLDHFAELKIKISSNKLKFFQLDVVSNDSISEFITKMKDENLAIDILLNNAGVAYPGNKISLEIYNHIFSTNVFGTINFTEKIIAENLIKDKGKIIFLASSLGKISRLSENIQINLASPDITEETLFNISDKFKNSIINKTYMQEGFGKHIYALSKILIKKYAEILARKQQIVQKNIQVYSCCPGWVKTDLGGYNASRTIEEGIITILHLIELEHRINNDFQGKFFYDCQVTNI